MSNLVERSRLKELYVKIEKHLEKKTYNCLYDGCGAPAIKSHSQQKSGPLRSIAEAGKVYRLDHDFQKSYMVSDGTVRIQFSLKGVGESTLFPGFCNEHEKIFSIFENQEIETHNHQQFCALFYRTFCYEKARKRRESDRLECIIQYGAHHPDWLQPLQEKLKYDRTQSLLSCDYPINSALRMMAAGDYSLLSSKCIKIQGNLNVSCSSVLNLHLDNTSHYHSAHPDAPLPGFTFNLLPGKDYTWVIFSWLAEFNSHAQWLLDGVRTKESLEILLNRFSFCDSEDSCINPTLWRSLSNIDAIIRNMHHANHRGILKDDMIPKIIKIP